jgi:hypothetical protein
VKKPGADASQVRGLQGPQCCIAQQRGAKTAALPTAVDG